MTANQRRTEPVPPTEGHDVPTPGRVRADAGAGTSTGPGPREGVREAAPAIARDGLADGEPDNRAEGTTTF
jgi:hypothetical protein